MRTLAALLLIVALPATTVRAQTVDAPLARADMTASFGWFGANHAEEGVRGSEWSASAFKGLGAGYYWTDHLKTDAEIGWPGPTEAFRYPAAPSPTAPSTFVYENHTYHATKFSLSQSYQFGRNAVVHPFLGGGVDVDRERDDVEQIIQRGASTTRSTFTEHEVRVRPFVSTGFKAYFSERAFFKGDAKVSLIDRAEQMIWRAGVGVDLGGTPPSRRRPAARSSQAPQPAAEPPDLWRRYAAKLPVGSSVMVQTTGGDRFVASLLAVDDTGVLLKPTTRVAEPVRHVTFDALAQLEPRRESARAERAGAIGVGVGAGTGTFLTLLFIALSHLD
jgi:hypothetical protein